MTQIAPFDHAVAEGPQNAKALWVTASDGIRLRVGLWPDGDKGTILLFPGRTEYLEKYGRSAGNFNALGYAVAAIDWRGQGIADRLLDNPLVGHVRKFSDYQLDVDALLTTARAENLPEPYYMVAHSMGGCIGLRGLINGLPVKAAAFTAPMWGIEMKPHLRPIAWTLSFLSRLVGQGHRFAPGTTRDSYVNESPFDDNMLTTDPEMYRYMQAQLAAHPEFALAGPSLNWLFQAMCECCSLKRTASPQVPTLTYLGSNERVVDDRPIRARMPDWPNGVLHEVSGAEHEILMEIPATRDRAHAEIAAHFDAHT